jgi:hypothetical protein
MGCVWGTRWRTAAGKGSAIFEKEWRTAMSEQSPQQARATTPSRTGWTVIAHRADDRNGLLKHQAWTLYHQSDKGDWHNFVVRHNDPHFRKFSYWGAWNGQRLARNKDLAKLQDKHPRIYTWLQATCRRKWGVQTE